MDTAWVAIVLAGLSLGGSLAAALIARTAETRVSTLQHQYAELAHLHEKTGPLRLYMYLSSRSTVIWLNTYASAWAEERSWPVRTLPEQLSDPEHRTAGPLVYRILRPMTVAGMIVHRTRQSDLAFDDERVVAIVRFHNAAYDMLTRQEVLTDAPEAVRAEFDDSRAWGRPGDRPGDAPFDRIRDTSLRAAADELTLETDGDVERRCMTHADFVTRWEDPATYPDFHRALEPLTTVLDAFAPAKNPVFWFRLLGYAYTCEWYLQEVADSARRRHVELDPPRLDLAGMLRLGGVRRQPSSWDELADEVRAHYRRIIARAL